MIKQMKINISGQVQGVLFRAKAKKMAISLGLVGYVKNLNNGTVEIIAEGEEEDLKNFIEWAKHGPKLAQVEKVDVRWVNATGNCSNFQIE